tara:strand:- start:63 stop:1223 length:1161 start_codon:yes stop_codon:yes gene_type:complete
MPDSGVVKYHVKLKFEIEGVVEKADLIGAIFGQTEGLFGPEMNLNELQKTWKIGRIEINLTSKNDKTSGDVIIPMSTDISTAAVIAAAVESVEKVGPCGAHFQLVGVEDIRSTKRKAIVDRAKGIMKEWASRSSSQGEELLKDVSDATHRSKIISYGKDSLPAGSGVFSSGTVFLVEGRADVNVLLRAGLENVVALEGTSVPNSVIKLSKEKEMIALLDGDRGGDLIQKELTQVARIHKFLRAPTGKEVEDLTPIEVLDILKNAPKSQEAPKKQVAEKPAPPPTPLSDAVHQKILGIYTELSGTLEGLMLNKDLDQISKLPVSGILTQLESATDVKYIVFDGIVTQRLVDSAAKAGVEVIVGLRLAQVKEKPAKLTLKTFRDLGLE